MTLASIAMESKRRQAGIEHPAHFAFRRRLRPRGPTLAIACRTARWLPGQLIDIFPLECLSKPLQFKNQRRALRSDARIVRSTDPVRRRCFVVLRMIDYLHEATLSVSAARWSTFADGGDAACRAAAAWPVALRTRAKTSSLGPNAITLPS